MKKRLLSMLLALVMVLSVLPVTALAADATNPNETRTTNDPDVIPTDNPCEGYKWVLQDENGTETLICTNSEHDSEHVHRDDCYELNCVAGHPQEHTSDCYTTGTGARWVQCDKEEHYHTFWGIRYHQGQIGDGCWLGAVVNAIAEPTYGGFTGLKFIEFKGEEWAIELIGNNHTNGVFLGLVNYYCYDPGEGGQLICGHEHTSDCYKLICSKAHTDACYEIQYTWEQEQLVSYTVSFDSDGGTEVRSQSVYEGRSATEPNAPTKDLSIFRGWYLNGKEYDFDTAVNQDITLKAKWADDKNNNGIADNDETFTVVYTDGGEGVFDTETTGKLSVGDSTPGFKGSTDRAGYSFDGWTPAVAATVDAAMADQSSVITYTASWTEIGKVTVTFDSNGGSDVDKQEILKGAKATKPADPTKALSIFQGWYLDGNEYNFDTVVNQSITLTAQWADDKNNNGKPDDQEQKYTVVYTDDVNGAAFENQSYPGQLVGLATPAFDGEPTYAGHVFTGWEPEVEDYVDDADANENFVITYTATWAADGNGNGVPDEDETVTITVEGDGSVTVNGEVQTTASADYVYDSTKESGVTFTATPGANDYVASITGADTDTLSKYGTGRSYEYTTADDATVSFAEKDLVAKETIGKVVFTEETSADELKQNIFNAVIDTAASKPAGVAWDDLTYEYVASAIGYERNIEINDLSKLALLAMDSVTLVITWPGDDRYPADSVTVTVKLTDGKMETSITVDEAKKTQTVVYGSYDEQDLLDAYDLVIKDEDGAAINYTAEDMEIIVKNDILGLADVYALNVKEEAYTLTVKYLGNDAYAASEIDVELIVVKAPSEVAVTSGVYRYNEVPAEDIITVTSNGKDAAIKTIDILVGLDVHDETNLTGVAKVAIPSQLLAAMGNVDLTLSLPELQGALEAVAQVNDLFGGALIDSATINTIVDVLSAVQEYLPEDVELQIELVSDLGVAQNQNAGLYLVGAVTADPNYETSFGVGYLFVYPNGIRANLAWEHEDDNGLVVYPPYDLSAYVASLDEDTFNNLDLDRYPEPTVDGAAEHLEHLFMGVNLDGELVLTQDQSELKIGTYTEIAYITNWDNQMYYAIPLVRSLTIVPNLAEVKFVNSPTDLTENNDRLFTYDGTAKEMPVAVNGAYMAPGDGLTVTYIGLSGDAEGYHSTTAPSKAGAYTVIATYAEKNEDGDYVVLGGAVGAMVIQKADLDFSLEDDTVTYDGEGHFAKVNNALGADYLAVALDYEYNTAYVTLPKDLKGHIDEIIAEIANIPLVGEELSAELAGYADELFGRLPVEFDADLTEVFALMINALQWIGEQEYVEIPEGIQSFLNEFETLINSLPKAGKVVIGELPSAIGTYECYALTYSANYKSVLASATLEIVPIEITVTMDDKTMTVGDAVPEASYTDDSAEKLLSGHSLSVTGKYTGEAAPAAGTYAEVYDADTVCDAKDENGTDIYDITVVKGDLTVNAKTVEPTIYYTVTFVDRGSVLETVEVEDGNTVSKPADPSRRNYTFLGWYLNGSKYDFGAAVTTDLTLTAKWSYDDDDYYYEVDDDDDKGPAGELIYLNKEDHTAYMIGYEDGTVRPNGDITRAEVATIYFRLLDEEVRDEFWSTENPFYDVAPTAWYNTAVSTLYNLGVIVDCEIEFRPNDPITRAELAVMAAQFADIDDYERCSFDDVSKKYWAADEIAIVEAMGWIEGYPDGSFRPDRTITRAETVTIINRMLERAVDEDHMRDDMVTFPDNIPGIWYYEEIQEAANSHKYKRTNDEVKDYGYCYERWTRILEAPNWSLIEQGWYAKHIA